MKQNWMVKIILLILFVWCGRPTNAQNNGTRSMVNSSVTTIPTTVHPSTETTNDSGSKLGLIIGCVVAAVFVALIAIAILCVWVRRSRRQDAEVSEQEVTVEAFFMSGEGASDFSAEPTNLDKTLLDYPRTYGQEDYAYESSSDEVEKKIPKRHKHKFKQKKIRKRRHPLRLVPETYGQEDYESSSDKVEEPNYPGDRDSLSPFNEPDKPVEKIITTADGGAITLDNFTLTIAPGCLKEDTRISLKTEDDQYIASICNSLCDLGLLDAIPQVVRFSPDGLKFLKPAVLAIDITFAPMPHKCDSELFILHGSYNPRCQRTVWEVVTNGIEQNNVEGILRAKINSFSFYSYILAKRGTLARILSHLNHSFTCRAYAFYRRLPAKDTIDISAVLVSEFVDEDLEEDIRQIKDHVEAGYVKEDKGFLKPVRTNCSLEMSLCFEGLESTPFSFKIDQCQLDSAVGFVVDHFRRIAVGNPASGTVMIDQVQEQTEKTSLWELNISENEEKIKREFAEVQHSAPELKVVNRTTKLTDQEIGQIGRHLGIDWDKLAGLMDIPYSKIEEIRTSPAVYLSFSSKAKRVFELFNESESFDRRNLEKHLEELGRHNLKNELLPVEDEDGSNVVEKQPEVTDEERVKNHTPLSSREMYRLSQRLVVDWERLAALLGVTAADRDEIRYSLIYTNNRCRAEKMLAIFNDMEDFSREKLAECLAEIEQPELRESVITGELRG